MAASYNVWNRNSSKFKLWKGGDLREEIGYRVKLNAVKLREES